MSTLVPNASALRRLAARAISDAPERVWLLQGPLGAGKTTFVRGMLRQLGVRGVIASPTFTLSREYRLRKPWQMALHIDGYRVRHSSELPALGLFEALANPKALIIIEWPELLPDAVWGPAMRVRLTIRPHGRQVQITRWAGGRLAPARSKRLRQSSARL